MAVPKKRTSVKRKGLRRAGHNHKLYAHSAIMSCPNCQSPTTRNHVCPSCGQYRGRQVVTIKPPKEDEVEAEAQ